MIATAWLAIFIYISSRRVWLNLMVDWQYHWWDFHKPSSGSGSGSGLNLLMKLELTNGRVWPLIGRWATKSPLYRHNGSLFRLNMALVEVLTTFEPTSTLYSTTFPPKLGGQTTPWKALNVYNDTTKQLSQLAAISLPLLLLLLLLLPPTKENRKPVWRDIKAASWSNELSRE